jgi:hypothetical protein
MEAIMNKAHSLRHLICISLLALFTALGVATTASAVGNGLPPGFGKVCGHVNGAKWKFQGQTSTRYSVIGKGGTCTLAMKVVPALTKQKPHSGKLGPHTLNGPRGYDCYALSTTAHAGSCVHSKAKGFSWAPQLKK